MTIQTWIILISWLFFILYWALSSLNVKKDVSGKGSWYWSGRGLLARLVIIAAVISAVLFRGHTFNVFGVIHSMDHRASNVTVITVGTALVVLGIMLAAWSRAYLGRNWSSHPALKEGHELVVSGPYKLIRHPIYTGVLIALLGTAIVGSIWSFIAFILFCFVFVRRVFKEEKIMTNEFPQEYPAYKKGTWALIPYVW